MLPAMEVITIFDFLWNTIHEEYDIMREMKRTQRGTVWLVRHRGSGKRYVFRRFSGSAKAYETLTKISCQNLPQVYQAAEKDGEVLVLEEYVEGDSLMEVLEGGTLTKKQTGDIARQLCAALWILHKNGLVHRDVKPENIILRGDQAVLIDFDASRSYKEEEASSDTVILGTVGYASPEQYGLAQTDGRADIYALGVVINLMLTGTHPSIRLAKGRWGRIVQRCTMTNPEKRYRDTRELLDLL